MIHIKNARVLTMAGKDYERGDIIISDGKIREIGTDLPVQFEAEVIDASGLIAVPGLIDAHCHAGMSGTGSDLSRLDYNELSDPFTPQLSAVDGFDPNCVSMRYAREGGVTTIMTGQGSGNIIAGQFAIFKTCGGTIEDTLVKAPAGMKAAFGQNPMKFHGREKGQAPYNRMSIAAQLRAFLQKAREYREERLKEGSTRAFDEKYDAMIPVFDHEIPMKIHAHRVDDMNTAIRIMNEFSLDFTMDHCTLAHLSAKELGSKIRNAIVGPFIYVEDKEEVVGVSDKTAAALHNAGSKVAICSDWPVWPQERFALQAGLAVCEELSEEEVWKMITINPAEMMGISDRVGSLEPGKDADIALFRGNPLRDIGARTEMTIIEGRIVYSAQKGE